MTDRVKSVTLRVVSDNQAEPPFCAEHGLSLWIEADDRVVLFDTGPGPALEENLNALRLDPQRVDAVVLSHGHFDHTGGLAKILRAKKGHVPVYFHPDATKERFSRSTGKTRSIGMPPEARDALDRLDPSLRIESERPVRVVPGVWATGTIPRARPPEGADDNLFLPTQRPDPVEDDQALLIRTARGTVVVMGCGHAGVANTLSYAGELFPGPLRAVVGGLHLSRAERPQWETAAAEFRRHGLEKVVTAHCTGQDAAAFLRKSLGPCCVTARVGDVCVF